MADSRRPRAKLLTRTEGDQWNEQALDRGDVVEIACGDAQLTLSLDDLYEDTGLLTW